MALNVPTCTVSCYPKSLIISDFNYSPAFCMKKVMRYKSFFGQTCMNSELNNQYKICKYQADFQCNKKCNNESQKQVSIYHA